MRQHTCRLALCSWALHWQLCVRLTVLQREWLSRHLLIVDVGAIHLGCLALFTDFSGLGAILSIFLVANTGLAQCLQSVIAREQWPISTPSR